MKVILKKADLSKVSETLEKLNSKNSIPNNFVKAVINGENLEFYSVEGNEFLFVTDAESLKGWEDLHNCYIGTINVASKEFEFSVFSELHTHSEFSILDGANRIPEIAKKYPYSGALTDHGVIYGWVEFYKAMKEQNKHPIMGCEVYTRSIDGEESKYHLILLAKNDIGANNIIRITSEAQEHENYGGKFPQRPLVSYEMLEKYHEGIVCLSACMGGEIPQKILAKDNAGVDRVILKMKELFGEDYYIEIQRHANKEALEERVRDKMGSSMTVAVAKADATRNPEGFKEKYGKYLYQDLFYIEEEEAVNKELLALSVKHNIKVVATNDAHYLNKEDAKTHEFLLCNQTKKTMDDVTHWFFLGTGYYIHTSEEMEEIFSDIPEALVNTLEVAEKCQYEMDFGHYKLPRFEIPDGYENSFEYLKALTYEGFKSRYSEKPELTDKVRLDRLEFELSVIEKMGYSSYFLIVWDFIRYAKENGIAVGPGRGSAAGSLVCYCLRITELDPIPYNLLFERFLNPDRVSMPDIDIDFQDDRREEVVEYCKKKYGVAAVASIITFGTMAARKVIEDLCRVYNISDKFGKPNKYAAHLKDFIPDEAKMTISKALDSNPELRAEYESNENTKFIIDEAMKLEGLKRNVSTHACGKVICDGDINKYCPTVSIYDKETETWMRTVAWNMTEIEEIGLLKMDFLGLKTMTILQECVETINEFYGTDLEVEDIPIDDVEAYRYISQGNTVGVFQLESSGMTGLMMKMYQDVPKKIEEIEKSKMSEEEKEEAKKTFGRECFERLIAGISLYRPGPMNSIPSYLMGLRDKSKIKYDTPELESILEATYGQFVYQEQVIQTVQKLARFSPGQSDYIRKAMGLVYGPYIIEILYRAQGKNDEDCTIMYFVL